MRVHRLLSVSGVAAAYYPGADKCEPTASPSLRRLTLAATDENLDYVSIKAVLVCFLASGLYYASAWLISLLFCLFVF